MMDSSLPLMPDGSASASASAGTSVSDPLATDPNDPRVKAMVERAESYGKTLRPKDCVILAEEIRVHMAKTRFMKAFISEYLVPILE